MIGPVRGDMLYTVPTLQSHEIPGRLKNVRFVPHPKGKIIVWEPPEALPGEKFALALDPCNGIPGGDDAAIEVLTVKRCRQVAEWVDNVNPVDAVDILCALGQWYNWGMINAEINVQGHAIIERASQRAYPSYYHWPQWDEAKRTKKLFWQTNRHSRPAMFSTMLRWFENKMIAISSNDLLGELTTFQKMIDSDFDSEGAGGRDRLTYKQAPKRPDNRVMAFCIAIKTIQQSPLFAEHTPYEDVSTAQELGLHGYNEAINAAVYKRVDETAQQAQDLMQKLNPDAYGEEPFVWNPFRENEFAV